VKKLFARGYLIGDSPIFLAVTDSGQISYGSMKLLAITMALLSSAFMQAPPTPQRTKIDVSKLGPQVGERIPDFSLKDQNGNTQTLRSIMGSKGAMLVFVRSADW